MEGGGREGGKGQRSWWLCRSERNRERFTRENCIKEEVCGTKHLSDTLNPPVGELAGTSKNQKSLHFVSKSGQN